jgi:hypothetical protein
MKAARIRFSNIEIRLELPIYCRDTTQDTGPTVILATVWRAFLRDAALALFLNSLSLAGCAVRVRKGSRSKVFLAPARAVGVFFGSWLVRVAGFPSEEADI